MSILDRRASPSQEGLDAAFIVGLIAIGAFALFPNFVGEYVLVLAPAIAGVIVGFAIAMVNRRRS